MASFCEKDVEAGLCAWIPKHYAETPHLIDVMVDRQVFLPTGGRADVLSMAAYKKPDGEVWTRWDVWEVKLGTVSAATLNQLGEYWLSIRQWLDSKYLSYSDGGAFPDISGNIVGDFVQRSWALSYARASSRWGPFAWTYSRDNGVFDFKYTSESWTAEKHESKTLNRFIQRVRSAASEVGNVEAR